MTQDRQMVLSNVIKKIWRIRVIVIVVVLSGYIGCAKKGDAVDNKLKVFVSIAPQKYFVEKIGGAFVDVTVLVPAGSSPHSFEPKPLQMAQLSQSKIYFSIGIEFEKAWIPRIQSNAPKLQIVPTDSGIVKIQSEHDHHDETGDTTHSLHSEIESDHQIYYDPHIWLAPELVKKQAATICDALVKIDPANAKIFENNCALFIKEIERLQGDISQIRAACPQNQGFMIFHPAWAYFAKEFNLQEYPIEIDGKEPSPKELMQLVKFAKDNAIKTIFIQPQFSPQTAKQIAKEVGANTIEVNDLAENWAENMISVAKVTGSCTNDK